MSTEAEPEADPVPAPPSPTEPRRLRGADRVWLRALFVPPILWFAGAAVAALLHPNFDDATAWIVGLTLVGAFAPLVLSMSEALPAALDLDGHSAVLRHALGLARRTLSLREVEVGRIVEPRPSGYLTADEIADGRGHEDRATGHYLRLVDGARSITVACRKKTPFRDRFDETSYRRGPTRRRWDLTLSRDEMIVLEDHLAAIGLLTRR